MTKEQSPGAIKASEPTYVSQREKFIEKIIAPLDIPEPIKAAFAAVDRAEFAPPSRHERVYTDNIIPLSEGSSLSQPSLVAYMIAAVGPRARDRALEIGTATGYQASILAQIVDHVDTIEVNPELAKQAQNNFTRLGYDGKITVHTGDGTKGVAGAKFNNIIVTAALREMPQALFDQLAEEGFMIAPVGPDLAESRLMAYRKDKDGQIIEHNLGGCQFVPIETDGASGWSDQDKAQAEMKHYAEEFWLNLERIGKTPADEIKRLRNEMAQVLGRKTPLTTEQMFALGKLVSDAMNPDKTA